MLVPEPEQAEIEWEELQEDPAANACRELLESIKEDQATLISDVSNHDTFSVVQLPAGRGRA